MTHLFANENFSKLLLRFFNSNLNRFSYCTSPRFQFQLGRRTGFLERGRRLPPQRDEVLYQGQGQQSRNCRILLRRILVFQLLPDPPQWRLQQQPSDLRHHLSVRWSELLRYQEFENQSNDDEERLIRDQSKDSACHKSCSSHFYTRILLELMFVESGWTQIRFCHGLNGSAGWIWQCSNVTTNDVEIQIAPNQKFYFLGVFGCEGQMISM